ncbi:hypothetical protein A3A20_01000 [Candidatus Wolfebacteria bacterium RIFCSPLOWO2_01_FULL_45_19]|uniref:Uncharacterized protein n=1 Tax=Candidatus Wolfebacteria bacterium RIFCSPLOWO2_01_FULL_45_19 TaxID=1802557 RepID=A0A1F8DSL0_9BACT|nr:MAG: hypothetical protein UX23_C0003G0025 [Parcubacteria group bacterium GW2011_GWB1_45_9]OGM90815.1 MAG: hypothetical protein A3A20_01000 [Candidatus Wolfebacteria bacterium RIFCSPLOWO2_01_FULL_45_19]
MTAVLISSLVFLFVPFIAHAHCPLCTAGAVAAGGIAAWLGVGDLTVGIFIGAAALLLGWWLAKRIKKEYVPFQLVLASAFIFLTTILPTIPFMPAISFVYIPWFGEYGLVYTLNSFLLGSLLGAAVVLAAPFASRLLNRMRGDIAFPYQGMVVTLALLVAVAVLVEFVI